MKCFPCLRYAVYKYWLSFGINLVFTSSKLEFCHSPYIDSAPGEMERTYSRMYPTLDFHLAKDILMYWNVQFFFPMWHPYRSTCHVLTCWYVKILSLFYVLYICFAMSIDIILNNQKYKQDLIYLYDSWIAEQRNQNTG